MNLRDYEAVAAPFGGPIALTKLSDRASLVGRNSLRIYTASGYLLGEVSPVDEVKALGWTEDEKLVCVFADGRVALYTALGEYLPAESFLLFAQREGVKAVVESVFIGKRSLAAVVVRRGTAAALDGLGTPVASTPAAAGASAPQERRARIVVVENLGQPEYRLEEMSLGVRAPTVHKCVAIIEPADRASTASSRVLVATSDSSVVELAIGASAIDRNLAGVVLERPLTSMTPSPHGAFVAGIDAEGHLVVFTLPPIETDEEPTNFLDKDLESPDNQPRSVAWVAQEDAIALWMPSQGLRVIGPLGDSEHFFYRSPLCITNEVRCLRAAIPFNSAS